MALAAVDRRKVVVRKLPPLLPEADFQAAVDEVCQGKYNWFFYVPGKLSTKSIKHARAYLNFTDPLQVYDFKAAFDGHIFVNERGAQFRCAVEYAPYQKLPKKINKRDPREGTLDKDPEYQAFVADVEKDPKPLPSAEVQADRRAAEGSGAQPEGKRVTSLMQFLQDKWSGKAAADPSQGRSRRGKAKGSAALMVEPPPGFQALDGRAAAGGQKQSSGAAKRERAAAQEAVAKALAGVSLGSAKDSKPPKGKSRKGSRSGSSATAGQAQAAEPPVKILQKERTAEAEEPAANGAARTSNEDAEKPERQVRVRAGFQVYTPRVRPASGRSEAGDAQRPGSSASDIADTTAATQILRQAADISAKQELNEATAGSSEKESAKAVWQPKDPADHAAGNVGAPEGGLQSQEGQSKGQSRRRRGPRIRGKEGGSQIIADLQVEATAATVESLADPGNHTGQIRTHRAAVVGASPPKRHRGRRGGRGRQSAEGEPPPAKAEGEPQPAPVASG